MSVLCLAGTFVCVHVPQVILLSTWSRDPQATTATPSLQSVSNSFSTCISCASGQKLRIYPLLAAFEAFHNGSWHGANSIMIRDGGLLVKFLSSGHAVAVQHDIDGSYLRVRSRKATCSDCSHVLKPGADVCVWQAVYRGETKDSVCHFLPSLLSLLQYGMDASSHIRFVLFIRAGTVVP